MTALGSLPSGPGAPDAPAVGHRVDERVAGYGSAVFERAGRFVRRRAGTEGGSSTRLPWFLDLGGAVALGRLVLAEPSLDVELSDSAAGRSLRDAMAGRTLGVPRNRLCVAVLDVPDEVPARPSGNRNRAVRSALNAAVRAGIAVRPVTAPEERTRLAASAVRSSPRLDSWSESAAQHPEQRWWAAEAADGSLAGLAVAVVDVEWAALITLIGLGDARRSSTARFVLHHALVRALAAAGVERLAVLDDSPLLAGAGTRHLQRVLGYELARLRRPQLTGRVSAADVRSSHHPVPGASPG